MMTTDQFNKLSKYARDEITQLSSKIEELEGKLAQFGGDEESLMSVDSLPIPNGTVQFQLEGGHSAGIRIEGGILDVSFSHAVVVIPMATNRIRLQSTYWR